LTSFLQPLDVSLNKLFKDGVGRSWIQGMAGGIHEFIVIGGQKKLLFCGSVVHGVRENWGLFSQFWITKPPWWKSRWSDCMYEQLLVHELFNDFSKCCPNFGWVLYTGVYYTWVNICSLIDWEQWYFSLIWNFSLHEPNKLNNK